MFCPHVSPLSWFALPALPAPTPTSQADPETGFEQHWFIWEVIPEKNTGEVGDSEPGREDL